MGGAGMGAGPNAGMSEQEQNMIKMVMIWIPSADDYLRGQKMIKSADFLGQID